MGKTFESFKAEHRRKIQKINWYILAFQFSVFVVSYILTIADLVKLPHIWFARLVPIPIFWILNKVQRFS
jgi:hypothetical protein